MSNNANIGKLERINVADLNLYHKNPRRGNVAAIAESIRINGIYKPIVINRGTKTGRPNEILAGNHTIRAVRQLSADAPGDKWGTVDAYVVDLDDAAAARVVIADNRTSDLAATDDRSLYELLSSLDSADGTGYVDDDIDDLRAMLEEIDNDPPGVTNTYDVEGNLTSTNDDDAPMTDEEYKEEIKQLHNKYTHAAKAPIYETQMDSPPPLNELIDSSKTDHLLHLINRAQGVPEDVKNFLRVSAQRHTIINFKKVAEWYAHQPGEIQELAEQQALVIIDLDSALQHGYARLTGELRRYALEESGYDDAHPDPAYRNPHLDLTPEDEMIRENARTRSSAYSPEVG